MQIMKMHDTDLKQVCAIESEIFSSPWSEKSFSEAINKDENIYLVAKEGEKILGYCGLWGMPPEGEICNVAVQENVRRQGVARHLLMEAEKLALKQGIEDFFLEVRESNISARRLYETLGYRQISIRKNYYTEPVEDALIMQKTTVKSTTRQTGDAIL